MFCFHPTTSFWSSFRLSGRGFCANHSVCSSEVVFHESAKLRRWAVCQPRGKSGGRLLQAFSPSQLCPAVTTCSGVRSVPTRSGSVTGEDWPPPRCLEGAVGFCRWSNILTASYIAGRTPFTWRLALPGACCLFTVADATARAPSGTPRERRESRDMSQLSEVSTRGSRTSGKVGGTAGPGPPRLLGLGHQLPVSGGHDNCPEPCRVCCLYGNQVPSNQADQLGWGRGASRSRKQSLTWSEAGCVPFLQAPGGRGEVIAAWRPAPRAHLAPQQT